MSRIAATAVLLALLAAGMQALADEQLVLIVSAGSTIAQLDSLEVRKLFLGLTVTQDGNRLRPVLNETDKPTSFSLAVEGESIACNIPAHAIQSYVRSAR